MKHLQSLTTEYTKTNAIAQSAATPGSFPALFASQYYPMVYGPDGQVNDTVITLPGALSKVGYETAGFVSSNPFVPRFSDSFDVFWNGRKRGSHVEESTYLFSVIPDKPIQTVRRAKKILSLTTDITATELSQRARRWFSTATSPRFLFMHLMEPHEPYYPGLRRGASVGLIQSYYSLHKFYEDRSQLSEAEKETIELLYMACIDYLDAQFSSVLEFIPDDALIVITGDHGEEFDHGSYRHARLYDE